MGIELTPEEEKVLKELADNLIAMSNFRRKFMAFTLWASSVIIAGAAVIGIWMQWKGKV